ncbi:hypothetical protein D3C81_1155120 [compost metagenome]
MLPLGPLAGRSSCTSPFSVPCQANSSGSQRARLSSGKLRSWKRRRGSGCRRESSPHRLAPPLAQQCAPRFTLPSASRSRRAGCCRRQSCPPLWISPLAICPRQFLPSQLPATSSASTSGLPCRFRLSCWRCRVPWALAVSTPKLVSPEFTPSARRSRRPRCCPSRLAASVRLRTRWSFMPTRRPFRSSLPCGACRLPARSMRPSSWPNSPGQSCPSCVSAMSRCPDRRWSRLASPLTRLSPRRSSSPSTFQASPSPLATVLNSAGWPRRRPCRSSWASRRSLPSFSSPLLRNGPPSWPGICSSQ